ncbi:MAG TPA: UDP-N-acetylmuramoyl-L-alanine--D-glutamate ligase [Solirubrobacterales bacterium]|jgi:UDP-N-acetylmuramoylalanine--D-glutamate ligase|nr:UDP-N-acetylmuramoyl-L-alanine--D-glutamate ligase [Solirubrobacterales bacterium]
MIERPQISPGPYLVVGLARSGQAAAKLLASRGHEVTGVDAGMPEGTETLGDFGIEVFLETGGEDLLDRVETVIKSPGVPREAPVIVEALAAAKTVIGELELGWRMLPNPFIAVTGTNGKTTTAELLGAIYRHADMSAAVAGNIGTPVCELVGAVEADATIICEASSFQLEDAISFNPDCAVLLNIAPDHIDRHGTLDAYIGAKLSMFEHQRPGQFAVTGPSIDAKIPGEGDRHVVDVSALPGPVAMRGAHNLENAAAAAIAAELMGVPREAIAQALASFKGVEHRMEEVARAEEVLYVNDSKATNVAAALAALESFDRGVHAIFGGSLKGERFKGLREAVAARCEAAYLIGQSADQLADDLVGVGIPVMNAGTLENAVERAADAAGPGDTVLLAPACASFDQFKNYEHRGEVFKKLVQEQLAARAGQR